MNGSLDGLETGFESVLASGMSVQRRADLFATSFSNSSKFQLNYYKGVRRLRLSLILDAVYL